MNRTEARERMLGIVGAAVASLATPQDEEEALGRGLTLDPQFRAPSDPGYVESIDPYWAGAEMVQMIAVRQLGEGGLTGFTAEGATFTLAKADLFAMSAQIRSMSPIAQAVDATGSLGMIEIDNGNGYIPTSGGWPTGTKTDLDWS